MKQQVVNTQNNTGNWWLQAVVCRDLLGVEASEGGFVAEWTRSALSCRKGLAKWLHTVYYSAHMVL